MNHGKAVSLLTALVLAGAFAAGCGGDDDDRPLAVAGAGAGGEEQEATGGTAGEEATGGTAGEEPTGGTGGEEPTGGTGGDEPTGGTAGEEETGGTAGVAGETPLAGAGGTAGVAGMAGGEALAGMAGVAMAGTAGVAEVAGAAGMAGSAPLAGAAGMAGTAGSLPGGGAGGQAALCGNGVVDTGEVCDDGNALACGTCDSTCQIVQSAPATGQIEAAPRNLLVDETDTFTLDDGVNTPTVFEFDTAGDGCAAAGAECIDVSGVNSAPDVADAIATAINDVGGTLLITASVTGGTRVSLANDEPGAFGNQPITEDVADITFVVDGMDGALGADCDTGDGCNADDVCTSLSCTDGTCE
jgi:cysteine-rich repeat protein